MGFYPPAPSFISQQVAEKLNFASHCEEGKRRGNLKVFDLIVTGIASLRSQ
jgi:hypothetical protein